MLTQLFYLLYPVNIEYFWTALTSWSHARLWGALTQTRELFRQQTMHQTWTITNSKLLLNTSSGSFHDHNCVYYFSIYRNEYDLNLTRRAARQIDRTDALLGGFNGRDQEEHPLQRPTGEKTRKTYDFTKTYHVGLSCHDIQASQGTLILISITENW